ncbi:hypothetical protein JMJ54_18770 [Jeongeupia naejangsanensis]|uniref:Uncharacterized protein n=1 Tax=Jeongeupia naejangsanensis TaxID=613195 RepID=A0ABS2BQN3_9NEIS|nr:hypothetical protein [Jeongeupia naejangsanensis]MBM3117883.1 hypothetical protein [Jeongeupia naejangsanensis]
MRKPTRNTALLNRATRDRIAAALAGLKQARPSRPQRAGARSSRPSRF